MSFVPTPADKFSFGLWTVGWLGADQFGGATRAPLDPVEAVHKLAELGAYVTFHDDDVVPFGSSDAERDKQIDRFKGALAETGMTVEMVTTNMFSHPIFKDGGVHLQRPRASAATGCARWSATSTSPPSSGANTFVMWGGREGAEYDSAKDLHAAHDRYAEGIEPSAQYIKEKGYDLRIAIEPKPNEPRGDILLPTIGHALALIDTLEHGDIVGLNPEVGHEQMAGLNYAAGIAQALWPRQALPHRPERPEVHQVRPGPGVRPRRPVLRVRARGPDRERLPDRRPALRRPAPLRLQAVAHRGRAGVWDSAAANMRTYLLLKERAAAFRADPEVQAALDAARSPSSRSRPWPRARPRRPARRPVRVRGARRRRWSPARASASSASTSWRSSTCSAPALSCPAGDPRASAPARAEPVGGASPRRRTLSEQAADDRGAS